MATTSSLCAKAAVRASVIGARLHLAGHCSGLNVAIETRKVDGSDLANVRHSEERLATKEAHQNLWDWLHPASRAMHSWATRLTRA